MGYCPGTPCLVLSPTDLAHAQRHAKIAITPSIDSVCVIRPRGRALCVEHTQTRHAVETNLYVRIVEKSPRCVKLLSFVNIIM